MAVLDPLHTIGGAVQNAANSAFGGALPTSISELPAAMASSIPSLRTISKIAIGGTQLLLGTGQTVLGGPSATCSNPQLSCHNTTIVADLCCFNAPGGQLLQTQFWVRPYIRVGCLDTNRA
jgi:ribonuclease T2